MKFVGFSVTVLEGHRTLLEQWARDEDRSISAVLRRLIDQENERKQATQGKSSLLAHLSGEAVIDPHGSR